VSVWERAHRKGELLNIEPHPEIGSIADFFKEENVVRILDLGSGGVRNLVYLSRRGFDVHGCDVAPTGLIHTLTILRKKGLKTDLVLGDVSSLPYDADRFDAVVSIQVIHHNTMQVIKKTIDEIGRVLKAKGFVWITVPVSKNEPNRTQKEIEPSTFLPLDGLEKGLPHHYFKAEEIATYFSAFSIIDLHTDSTNHFSMLAKESRKHVEKMRYHRRARN
jgi:SAM-dependent methyltransferase